MKHISVLALSIVLIFSSLVCLAQVSSNNNVEATYSRKNDFFLKYADDSGGFSISLQSIYDKTNGIFIVKMIKGDQAFELMKMNEPLNYEYFKANFYDSIKKIKQYIKPISNGSLQEVYVMLYSLTVGDQDNDVNAGNLNLRKWVFVLENGKVPDSLKNVYRREGLLDSITDRYQSLQLNVATLQKNIADIFAAQIKKQTVEVDVSAQGLKLAKQIEELNKAWLALKKGGASLVKDQIEQYTSSLKITPNAKYTDLLNQAVADSTTAANLLTGSFGTPPTQPDSSDTANIVKYIDLNKKHSDIQARVADLRNLIKASDIYKQAKKETDSIDIVVTANKAATDAADIAFDNATDKFKKDHKDHTYYTIILEKFSDETFGTANELLAVINSNVSDRIGKADSDKIIAYFEQKALFEKVKDTLRNLGICAVKKVSLQFERGYLERVQVWVDNGRSTYIYENIYAIGFSSINNFRALNAMQLFIRKSGVTDDPSKFIYLSDAIGNYDNVLASFTRDYSPADTVVNAIDPASNPILFLKKERLINLFDSKIYTDFAGLKEGNPNGLVQIDLQRRFNLTNYRRQINGFSRSDWGIVDNITVFGAITKIEQKEKRLQLRNANKILNNKIISPSYATTLDLRQYENASLGADLNLGLFDYPDSKFTIFFYLGLRYGHTPLLDSIRSVTNNRLDTPAKAVNLDAHSFTWQPKVSVEIFAERRVGLTLTYQYNLVKYYTNNNFKPIVSYAKSDLNALQLEGFANYYHMFELYMRVETSRANNGKLFLRARYFMQRGDVNTFFPQVQLGYAYNLIFRK